MRKWIHIGCVGILVIGLIHLLYAVFFKSNLKQSNSLSRDLHIGFGSVSNLGQEIDLRVIILTYSRAEALARCLASLNNVDYGGDKVHVDIWIDRSKKDGSIHNKTFTVASQFKFLHGTVKVNRHKQHVGLYGQWLLTWMPTEDTKEIALFIEDDITVSRYIYMWLKLVHKKYDSLSYINGFSTQGKSIKHATGQSGLHGPETEVVFSYPVLGSWGFSPKVKNWLNFLSWFKEAHTDPTFVPDIPGLVVSKWYKIELKRGRADSMWTMWHIYYSYKNKELTVYPNLPGKQGLAINWEEPGLHYKGARKAVNKDPILVDWDDRYGDLPDEPVHLSAEGKVVTASVRI